MHSLCHFMQKNKKTKTNGREDEDEEQTERKRDSTPEQGGRRRFTSRRAGLETHSAGGLRQHEDGGGL